ncbi:hypothetical protein [Cumulibacter soli]|uniref:hypothetical protein n=1 Tax=Cumulibacter soli TaxID=2546344 RepID=UPI00106817A0|nr:hypothetical protein [Cumulibacter soli]
MPQISFDIDGLLDAAGRYDAAAAQSQSAHATLAALSFDPSALGSTPRAGEVGGALGAFGAQQVSVAAGTAAALGGFSARMRAVSGLGQSAATDTAAAAS